MEGIATEAALPGSTSYCSLETLNDVGVGRRGAEKGGEKRWKILGFLWFIWDLYGKLYGISTEVLWDLYGDKDG